MTTTLTFPDNLTRISYYAVQDSVQYEVIVINFGEVWQVWGLTYDIGSGPMGYQRSRDYAKLGEFGSAQTSIDAGLELLKQRWQAQHQGKHV